MDEKRGIFGDDARSMVAEASLHNVKFDFQ